MSLTLNTCIWCLGHADDKDVEHIFPESLGCPDYLVLSGAVVCKKCNNDLAHLDKAVYHEFDFIAFMYGINKKGNRRPSVSSRGNVFARHGINGMEIFVNGGKMPVDLDFGVKLTPYQPNVRSMNRTYAEQLS